jgi:hypothetical protein
MGQTGEIGRRRQREEGKTIEVGFFLNTGGTSLSFVTEALIAALRDGYCPKGWPSGK